MTETRSLLRKKDLVERSGIPKTTLTDWVEEFSPYVPIVRQGRTKYYTEKSLEVVERIRSLRAQEYDKVQIAEILAKEYPINVDEIERKAEVYRNQNEEDEDRRAVILAMQAFGEMAEKLETIEKEQKDMRETYEEKTQELEGRIEKQDEYIKTSLDDRDRKLMEHMRKTMEERKKRGFMGWIRETLGGSGKKIE
jgi:DNA-binding transcriptional MerR regulator